MARLLAYFADGGELFDTDTYTYPDFFTSDVQTGVETIIGTDYLLRRIQPRIYKLIDLYEDEGIAETVGSLIPKIVHSHLIKNEYKYTTLLATENFEYSPITNYDMTESEEIEFNKGSEQVSDAIGAGTQTTTYGRSETRTDNLANSETRTDNLANSETRTDNLANSETRTDNLANSETRTDNLANSSTATISGQTTGTEGARTDTTTKGIYGFNSSSAVDSDETTLSKGSQSNSGTSSSTSTGSGTNTGTVSTAGTNTGTVSTAGTNTGTVSTAGTNTGTVSTAGTNTGTVSTANSGADVITTGARTNTRTDGAREDTTARTLTRSGNIGVMTTQQMIEMERKIADFSFLKLLAHDIVNTICLVE